MLYSITRIVPCIRVNRILFCHLGVQREKGSTSTEYCTGTFGTPRFGKLRSNSFRPATCLPVFRTHRTTVSGPISNPKIMSDCLPPQSHTPTHVPCTDCITESRHWLSLWLNKTICFKFASYLSHSTFYSDFESDLCTSIGCITNFYLWTQYQSLNLTIRLWLCYLTRWV